GLLVAGDIFHSRFARIPAPKLSKMAVQGSTLVVFHEAEEREPEDGRLMLADERQGSVFLVLPAGGTRPCVVTGPPALDAVMEHRQTPQEAVARVHGRTGVQAESAVKHLVYAVVVQSQVTDEWLVGVLRGGGEG